jgi:hypothetical protein
LVQDPIGDQRRTIQIVTAWRETTALTTPFEHSCNFNEWAGTRARACYMPAGAGAGAVLAWANNRSFKVL